jgi:hypothetical protein
MDQRQKPRNLLKPILPMHTPAHNFFVKNAP